MDKEMKKIAKGFILSTLQEPFYLNIVWLFNSKEEWLPCWEDKYIGSTNRNKAVKLRKEFFNYLITKGSSSWRAKNLKTVKVKHYID